MILGSLPRKNVTGANIQGTRYKHKMTTAFSKETSVNCTHNLQPRWKCCTKGHHNDRATGLLCAANLSDNFLPRDRTTTSTALSKSNCSPYLSAMFGNLQMRSARSRKPSENQTMLEKVRAHIRQLRFNSLT